MTTVQITLEEELVEAVDRVSWQLHTTRSAFMRNALRDALDRYNAEQLERQHRSGYERYPVTEKEFPVWENEQHWGEK